MKAYLIKVLVIDFEDIGIDGIKEYISNTRHVHPRVISVSEADVDWHDDHPLNKRDKTTILKELFPEENIT